MQIGFFGILSIVFITLKVVGVIAWPWWLVLLPIWGIAAFALVVFLVVALVTAWAGR